MISNSTTNSSGATTMEGGGMVVGPKSPNIQGLKKGPWTAAEDAILIEYVKKHGEGNWNSVQRNSGLLRCGKSCRLRWANHLRPNLKKGSFTPEEEGIIIELHAKLGNKWARMASQLPGRTDNEIKNFWNTRMKRRQRAGLPVYPQEFHEEAMAKQQHDQPNLHNSSSSSSAFASLLSSRKPEYNPCLPLLDPINFSSTLNPLQNIFHNPFYANPTLQFKSLGDSNGKNRSLALPLSPVSQYARSPSSLSPFNQNIPRTPPLLDYDNVDFENNMSFTSLIMEAQVEPIGRIPSLKSEPPSVQTLSNASGGVCPGETSSKTTENDESTPRETEENKNSGLLDALLLESHNLLRKEKSNSDNNKGKRVLDNHTEEEEEVAKRVKLLSTNGDNVSSDDMGSSQSSIGIKQSEEPIEEMNSMDDDLLSLLDNFPLSTRLPEWYRTRNESDGKEVESHRHDSSPADRDDTPNNEWGLGSSYWNNMPGIC